MKARLVSAQPRRNLNLRKKGSTFSPVIEDVDQKLQKTPSHTPHLQAEEMKSLHQRYLSSAINVYKTAERRTASTYKSTTLENQGKDQLSHSFEGGNNFEMIQKGQSHIFQTQTAVGVKNLLKHA